MKKSSLILIHLLTFQYLHSLVTFVGSTIFYTVCILNTIFFVQVAKNLPELCQNFDKVEAKLQKFGSAEGINRKIQIFLGVFTVLAIGKYTKILFLALQIFSFLCF